MTALRVVPAAGLLLFLLIQFSSELIGIAFYAMGRAQNCSFEGAMDAVGEFDKQESVAASMKNLSRLVEKDAQGYELWDTPGGRYWVPAGGSQVLFDDMAEQERGIYSTRNRGVKRGDVVLDCGANIGQYSRVALAAGASKVIAIEPVPSNIEVLRRNLKDEIASGKVVIVEKGVWDKDGSLEMFIEADNIAAHSFVVDREKTGKKVQLPLTTIDKIVEELKLERVDYVKMDIEGAERNALAGGQATLKRFHPRMALCVYHLPDDPQVIPERVRSAWSGYAQSCGACFSKYGHLKPQVYFYQ